MFKPDIVELTIVLDAGEYNAGYIFRACTLPNTDTYLVSLMHRDGNYLEDDWFVVEDKDAMMNALLGFMYGDTYGEEKRMCSTIHYDSDVVLGVYFSDEQFDPLDLIATMKILELDEEWTDCVGNHIADVRQKLAEEE